jgi:hypothetical protein
MPFDRSSGLLLHIASLPSLGGIGDLGPAAYAFADFLAASRQRLWQVLPLGPTGYGNSPYASLSAFAGNPLLISLENLADRNWINRDRLASLPGPKGNIDHEAVAATKLPLLEEAARNFLHSHSPEEWSSFEGYCRENATWLNDWALYSVLRRKFDYASWSDWPSNVKTPRACGPRPPSASNTAKNSPSPRLSSSPSTSNGAPSAITAPPATSASLATSPSSSTTTVPTSGRTPSSSSSTRTSCPSALPVSRPTISRRPASAGAIPSTSGTSSSNLASPGGSTASAAPSSSTTSSASTTSAASRPTGPSPLRTKPPSTASGLKPLARPFSRSSTTNWATSPSSPKTSA